MGSTHGVFRAAARLDPGNKGVLQGLLSRSQRDFVPRARRECQNPFAPVPRRFRFTSTFQAPYGQMRMTGWTTHRRTPELKLKLDLLVGLFAFSFAMSVSAGSGPDSDLDLVPRDWDNCSGVANGPSPPSAVR